MRLPRWIVTLLVLPGGLAAAAGGERHLGPAPMYLSFRLQAGYDALAVVRALLPLRVRASLPMVSLGITRSLGFDLLSTSWMEAAGVDPAMPVWAALYSSEPTAVRARLGRIGQAAKRHLGSAGRSSFNAAEVAGPLAWVRHRLVIKLKDEAKAKSFVTTVANNLGSPAVLLQGKAKSAATSALVTKLGLGDAQAAALADALLGQSVLLLVRADNNSLALVRVVDGSAIVDFLTEVVVIPEKPGDRLMAGLMAALAQPKRAGLELGGSGLGKRVFTEDTTLAWLVRARPFLELMSAAEIAQSLRTGVFGVTLESFSRQHKEAEACRRSFAQAYGMVGDLGLQVRGDDKGLQVRGLWSAPPAVVRAFSSAAAKRDLVDMTDWQSKAVALAGLNFEIGPLLKALPARVGALKLSAEALEKRVASCSSVGLSTMLLGGWVGLLGVLKDEAKDDDLGKLLLEHGRNALFLVKALSSLSNPNLIAQVSVAPAGAAALQATVTKLAPDGTRPESVTLGGYPTKVFSYLKAPLRGLSAGWTNLDKDGALLTISSSRWDLKEFLGQRHPDSRILPPRVLAFGYAQLSKILTALQSAPELKSIGKLLRDLSRRLDDAGANVTVSEGALLGELRLGLKQR